MMDEQLPERQQPPMSHFSTTTYFTQQAIRAGYIAPRCENKHDHIQHQHVSMREAIMREIEKERIREEIIAEEIARRQMLEFDVRREVMMERQPAKQIGEGFSPFSSPTLPFLKQHNDDVMSVEERIVRSQMGRGISVSSLVARNEIRRLDIAPFEEWISEIPFHQRSFCD